MGKAKKHSSRRASQGVPARSLHNNSSPYADRGVTPHHSTLRPIVRPPKVFTKKIFAIIFLNFLATATLIGSTIFIVSQQRTPDRRDTTTTAETQVASTTIVTYAQGDAEYYYNQVWIPLTTSQELYEGSSIRTLADARLSISLPDGSTIRIAADTTITFTTIQPDAIHITLTSGRMYARVAPNTTRAFRITENTSTYSAVGTAYEVYATRAQSGVRVYESTVSVSDSKTKLDQLVTQGQQFFTSSDNKDIVAVVSNMNIAEIQSDEFVLWNKQQDEADPTYQTRLGFLAQITTAAIAAPSTITNTSSPIAMTGQKGIMLTAIASDDGIKLSWIVNDIDTSEGFKVAYSSSDTTPSYKESGSIHEYASRTASSAFVNLTDGKTWYFRICAFHSDDTCLYYSNTATVTAPLKTKQKVTRGAIDAQLTGALLQWDYSGTAPYGYKINWNTSGTPTYPALPSASNAGSAYLSNSSANSLDIDSHVSEPGTYFINICAYTNGTEADACVDFSQTLTYTLN